MPEGDPQFTSETPKTKRAVTLERFKLLQELLDLRDRSRRVVPESEEEEELNEKLDKLERRLGDFRQMEDDLDALKTGELETEILEEDFVAGSGEASRFEDNFESISDLIGTGILPPHLFLNKPLSAEEFKARFPVRFGIYEAIIEARQKGMQLSESGRKRIFSKLKGLNNVDNFISDYKALKFAKKAGKGERGVDSRAGEDGLGNLADSSKKKLEFREGQIEVFEKFQKFFERGGKKGYLELPTGFGKTATFVKFIEALGIKTLIVAPRTNLVDQVEDEFQALAPDISVGRVDKKAKETEGNAVSTTYISFVNQIGKTIKPEEYGLVIFDEAHHLLGSEERLEAFNKFEHAARVAFTATPEYYSGKSLEEVFEFTPICKMSLKEGIRKGLVASCTTMFAKTNIDLKKVPTKKMANGELEYETTGLSKTVNIKERNDEAVRLYQYNFGEQPLLAFCADIDHAEAMAKAFNDAGVKAAAYTNDTPEKDKPGLLAAFRRGEIKVLCGLISLREGFDAPNASVCFNLAPTLSKVNAKQRLGRVLRLYQNPITGEDKFATIVDFIDLDTSGRKFSPVLAPEVLEGTEIVNPYTHGGGGGGTSGETPRKEPIKLGGLTVEIDLEEIRKYNQANLDRRRQTSLESPPEEWVHITEAVKLLKTSPDRAKRIFEILKPKYPNRYGVYKTVGGRGEAEFFDPIFLEEAFAIIKAENEARVKEESRPMEDPREKFKDYINVEEVASELNQDVEVLKIIINKSPNPSQTNFASILVAGSFEIVCSREFVEELKAQIESWEGPPALWASFRDLKDTYNFSPQEEVKAHGLFNTPHADRRIYKNGDGKLRLFISPARQNEILGKVREVAVQAVRREGEGVMPEGSLKLNDLFQEFGKEAVLNQFKMLHAYKSGFVAANTIEVDGEKVILAELINYMRDKVGETAEGFVSPSKIARKYGVSVADLKSVEEYVERQHFSDPVKLKKEKRIDKSLGVVYGPKFRMAIEKEVEKRLRNRKSQTDITREDLLEYISKRHKRLDLAAKVEELLGKLLKAGDERTVFDDKLKPINVLKGEVAQRVDAGMAKFYERPPFGWKSFSEIIKPYEKYDIKTGDIRQFLVVNGPRFFEEGSNVFKDERGILVEHYPPELVGAVIDMVEKEIGLRLPEGHIAEDKLYSSLTNDLKRAKLDWSMATLMERFEKTNPTFESDNQGFRKADPRPGATGWIYLSEIEGDLRKFIKGVQKISEGKIETEKEHITIEEIAARIKQPIKFVKLAMPAFEEMNPDAVRSRKGPSGTEKVYDVKTVERKLRDIMRQKRLLT